MKELLFSFVGYDNQRGWCHQYDDGSYRLIFGAMIYMAETKEDLRKLVAWCLCPVTFERPEGVL